MRLWLLFLPLAASNLLMALSEILVASGIARMPGATVSLAAYGVILSTAILIEGPVIMLLHASNALVEGPRTFKAVGLFSAGLGLLCGGAHALLAFTPLYDLYFSGILGLPEHVAAAARPAFALMLPWAPAIAWRRFCQGVLIRSGRTGPVGLGTGVRLLALAAVLYAGASAGGWSGVMVGAAALSLAVMVEALYIQMVLLVNLRRRGFGRRRGDGRGDNSNDAPPAPGGTDIPPTLKELLVFYSPLAGTAFVLLLGNPVISAALARSTGGELALAIWPVVLSTAMLFKGPAINLEQLIIPTALTAEQEVHRRFAVKVGALISVVMLVFCLSGVMYLYLIYVVGLNPELARFALGALYLMTPTPLVVGILVGYSGTLIKARRTVWVNLAAAANLLVLAAGTFTLALGTALFGAHAAALSRTLAGSAEVLTLRAGSRDLLDRPAGGSPSAPGFHAPEPRVLPPSEAQPGGPATHPAPSGPGSVPGTGSTVPPP